MRSVPVALVVLLGFLFAPMSRALPVRYALVVGNDSYPGNALKNARSDAKSVAAELSSLGYRSTLLLDVDRRTLSKSIDSFVDGLHKGDIAFVYYAGHGLQVNGENYLVPLDFHVADEADVQYQGYALSELLAKMTEHGATTQVIILDACRDNPFLPTRSAGGGWAGLISSAGSFLAFGTSPGSTASDEPAGGHGLFTQSLLTFLGSNLEIEAMFQKVREDVIERSNGLQVPWTASSLVGALHVDPAQDLQAPALTLFPPAANRPAQVPARDQRDVSVIVATAPIPDPDSTKTSSLIGTATDRMLRLDFGSAVNILKDVLQLDPRSSIALRLLGLAFHLSGRSTEGVDALSRAIAINPNDATAYSYRCLIRMEQNIADGQEDCTAAIQLRPDSVYAQEGLSIALAYNERPSEAHEALNRAITINPNSQAGLAIQAELNKQQAR